MSQVRTHRFHARYGPTALFDEARGKLQRLVRLDLETPHAQSRFDERNVPLQYLTDFEPECWELITVETAVRNGRITYMSLRRRIESAEYLWIVLAYEYVITAWVTAHAGTRAGDPLIVRHGPVWEAVAEGQEHSGAMASQADVRARNMRALRVLDALATAPERCTGERLARAARLVLDGRTWSEAAIETGWTNRSGLDTTIARLLRAAQRAGTAVD